MVICYWLLVIRVHHQAFTKNLAKTDFAHLLTDTKSGVSGGERSGKKLEFEPAVHLFTARCTARGVNP